MIRTIRGSLFPAGPAYVLRADSVIRVSAEDAGALCVSTVAHTYYVIDQTTEAEVMATLGWTSSPPPPHPATRDLLNALAYDLSRFEVAASAWAAAGCPGARRA